MKKYLCLFSLAALGGCTVSASTVEVAGIILGNLTTIIPAIIQVLGGAA